MKISNLRRMQILLWFTFTKKNIGKSRFIFNFENAVDSRPAQISVNQQHGLPGLGTDISQIKERGRFSFTRSAAEHGNDPAGASLIVLNVDFRAQNAISLRIRRVGAFLDQ